MAQEISKELIKDPDGLLTYEYIANHIGQCDEIMGNLVDNMLSVDKTGQFIVSAARYLSAIDAERYKVHIDRLVSSAIERDRERRYIGELLQSLWGADYADHVDELNASDDNFRRIYKRLFPKEGI